MHELQHSDGWIEQIMFDDIVTFFLPKIWKRAEAKDTYASTDAYYVSAIYFANAIHGQPTAANDASLYTESATVSEATASATPDRLQWA